MSVLDIFIRTYALTASPMPGLVDTITTEEATKALESHIVTVLLFKTIQLEKTCEQPHTLPARRREPFQESRLMREMGW
jgi:hypothetical protein